MDLSSSSLRSPDVGGPDPAIMLFGKRIQGRPSTIDAADIKEELSPRGVDEGGAVSCGTTSSDEEEDLSSSQNVGTNKDEIKEATGGEAKAKGTGGELKVETEEKQVRCPRCSSADTKFCYFNNYNVNQPRHFCKRCQRYWTAGGTLRNVPVGAGKRKSKHSVSSRQAFPPLAAVHSHSAAPPTNLTSFLAHSVNTNLDLFAGPRPNPQCTVFSTEIKGPLPNLQLEPPELGVTNPIPQIGSSGLHEIKADSQTRFFRLGEINPNLQSEFSRLGEINANLQSGSCGSGKKNVNLQSGFSGLGEINSNLKTGFPGLGGIKANLQSGFHGLGANHQSGFSRLDQNKANLQSGLDQNKANLHIECPESNTIKPNSHSGGNESREMKGYLQWSSEIEPSGCSGLSESKARLAAGECNGLSQIKAPHLCFHSDEPHLISLSNSTEGGVNTKSLEGCYEAQGSWCSGQVLPVLGGLWPCFYNMYWADGGGKPQQGIMPHLAPVLTPQGWGVSCVGAMATPISSSFAATAPCMATAADPPQLPPPAMLGKNGNVPTNTTSATTTLGKRAAQHGSIQELELGGLFCNSKSSKVCEP